MKTVLVRRSDTHQFEVMLSILINALTTFQYTMDEISENIPFQGAYLDGGVIFFLSPPECIGRPRDILSGFLNRI